MSTSPLESQICDLLSQEATKQLTIKQIAERLGKDLGNISRKVSKLQKDGVVKKTISKGYRTHSYSIRLLSKIEEKEEVFTQNKIESENIDELSEAFELCKKALFLKKICPICLTKAELINHHISYFPEITIPICRKCHINLHDLANKITPSKQTTELFYGGF